MFNVLPPNLKEKIKAEYRIRYITLVLLLVLCLQVSFLVFLLPSWITSVYKERDATVQLENIRQSPLAKGASPIASIITDTNKKLVLINSILQYPEVTPIVQSILANKTSPVRLNEFLYTSKTASTSAFLIGGVSSTREGLVSFVKNLEKSGEFKTVYLPVSQLAKDKNLDFSITLGVEKL
jgi:ABC-type phosphate transport system substrate-binding protein